jgi:hypothetical protein
MPQTNKALAENSPANLDRRFDRALEETFPTSDSVSVTITKGGAIDYDEHGMAISGPPITSSQRAHGTAKRPLNEAKDALSDGATATSGGARAATDRNEHDAGEAVDKRPEAERKVREGIRVVRQADQNPLLMPLVGVGIGYALAWMVYAGGPATRKSTSHHNRPQRKAAHMRDGRNTEAAYDVGSA